MPLQRQRARRTARVSQQDIAREAGVSRVTVSLVLSGKDQTSPETRRRVLDAAQRLKYRPNLLVHGMQTGRTFCAGIIFPPGTSGFLARVMIGIHDELVRSNYVPIVLWTDPDPAAKADELAQIHRVVDRRVDGVILWPADVSVPDAHFHEIWERNIPLVTVDRETRTHADHVGTDEQLGGRLAAEHLLGLGHRRVAVLNHNPAGAMAERCGAFAAAIRAADATCLAPPVTIPSLGEVVAGLFRDRAAAPTALFAANDVIAARLYGMLAELGLGVGSDVSVLGYADLSYAENLVPPLTTIRQDPYEIGRLSARLLLDRVLGRAESDKPRRHHLQPELIVRSSTAPPRSMTAPK